MKKAYIPLLVSLVFVVGCSSEDSQPETSQEDSQEEEKFWESGSKIEEEISHVHGLGYFDSNTIAFASHTGLKLYQDEEWLETEGHRHDYMGFNAVDSGFYTSGHPNLQSDYPNPLGLQKLGEDGEELESLAVEGESDFHVMGVGYQNNAIYLLNEQENSLMDQGYYKSLDDGETWEAFQGDNIKGSPFQIAVHPTEDEVVAIATDSGVYLSEDAGESFSVISDSGQGSGLFFTEEELQYGLYDGKQAFYSFDLENRETQSINIPSLAGDAIMYTARQPKKGKEMVIYTAQGNSFISQNSGESWSQILEEGAAK
ncbi:F510_1955 family glycosylhydrolase [Halobacillus seohaensis]|uniref:F510_1955 family glycosylhydrolase n=1 Tax=Halobacillus seohaensis TaxID=447421 RepID=A0ABW2EKK9_9BACI